MPLIFLLLACSTSPPRELPLALAGSAQAGEAQYQIHCARCHGQTGGGAARTPALKGRTKAHTDEVILGAMLRGRGAMTPLSIDDQTAANILAYVRAEFD